MVTANSNQVALITGCSEPGSLGASLALELRKRGWQVIATARKIETMKLLATEGCHVGVLSSHWTSQILIVSAAVGDSSYRSTCRIENQLLER